MPELSWRGRVCQQQYSVMLAVHAACGASNLTVSTCYKLHMSPYRQSSDEAVAALVRKHVPAAILSTRGGTELAFKLPRDESSRCVLSSTNQ